MALPRSAATHAVLPLLATREGLRLQLDAGIRSHRRRFGWDGGFWLPECAYDPGLEWRLAEQGVEWFCVDQSRHEEPARRRWRRCATEAGPVALPIDWEAICWLWALSGYPSDPAYADFDGKSLRGMRLWKIGGGAYDPAAAARGRAPPGRRVPRRRRGAPARATRRSAGAAACSSSRSTPSCSATGGRRDRPGSRRCSRAPRRPGCGCSPCPQALEEHEPEPRPLRGARPGARSKDFRTWDSPPVADLAWARAAARAAAAARALAAACAATAPTRAARELLAAQASDWAFLDRRRQAGDYAYQRATDHAGALFEAIDCRSRHRSAYAFPRPGPRRLAPPARALRSPPTHDPRPDPLLGVPAADRGRPRSPRPQALRGAGRRSASRSTC